MSPEYGMLITVAIVFVPVGLAGYWIAKRDEWSHRQDRNPWPEANEDGDPHPDRGVTPDRAEGFGASRERSIPKKRCKKGSITMDDLIIFGMPLSDFLFLAFKLSIGYGVILAAFIMWGERHWKGMADELDELAGSAEELESQGFWEAFRHGLANAWRRDVWVPLAVMRAWFRHPKD